MLVLTSCSLGNAPGRGDISTIIARVASRLTHLLTAIPGVTLALENMFRKSTPGGTCSARSSWSISTLGAILARVPSPQLKVCVDICHAYIAEYDLYRPEAVRKLLGDIHALGEGRVAGFHVSDSASRHGARCDGHITIGA